MKNAKDRASAALAFYLTVRTEDAAEVRAHDDCWESGDGDEVLAIMQDWARKAPDIARAVLSYPACRFAPSALQAVAKEALA